ncbi:hypothetical protein CRI93_03940 [Longimonas halophila]|uniref:Uncharacterized protein n=1 Tax=Longimonas halophila TaxID=1469170 RepID=A0A2H3P291_9BACT|nr:hypothetical protein [Longimonas halophila]PEN08282.1 hypothetical protein CRI93_03940 [Longimonas halophila]
MRFLWAAVVLILLPVAPAVSQPASIGVVWTPTGPSETQVQALRTMRDAGLRHVRAAAWPRPEALQAAHTFGLQLYIDLAPPVADPSVLRERLAHPAVRGVGWAGSLTTRGCARWNALRSTLPPSSMRYVVAPVAPAGVACSFDASTTVLADVRMLDRPFARWYQWRAAHAGPVGLAALGPARMLTDGQGWQVPRSMLAQARTLEHLLEQVHTRGVPIAFTAAWSTTSVQGPLRFHIAESDSLLPPGKVVAASTTGPPPPFAWPTGSVSTIARAFPTSTTLAIWGLVLGLMGVFVRLPTARRTVLRYLFTHGFYRASLREGRDATGPTLAALGLLVGGALWSGGQVLVDRATWLRPILLGLEALPPSLQSWVDVGMTHPGFAAAVVTLALGGALLFWTTAVALGLQAVGTPVSWSQVLMMGLLPWWGAPLWAFGAAAPAVGTALPLVLFAIAFAAAAWSALRTAYDLHRTIHPPLSITLGAALCAPGSILLFAVVGIAYSTGVDGRWVLQLLVHA